MSELILMVVALVVLGLMGLGYFVAGRWWTGGMRWLMGFVLGSLFFLTVVGILVAGCTILVFTQ